MGGAVVFVITIASFITGAIYQFILHPAGFEYLKIDRIHPGYHSTGSVCRDVPQKVMPPAL